MDQVKGEVLDLEVDAMELFDHLRWWEALELAEPEQFTSDGLMAWGAGGAAGLLCIVGG